MKRKQVFKEHKKCSIKGKYRVDIYQVEKEWRKTVKRMVTYDLSLKYRINRIKEELF